MFFQKDVASKKLLKKNFDPKSFWYKQIFLLTKYLGQKSKMILLKNLFGPKNILVKRRFEQKKCWSTKFTAPKKSGPKSLVKIFKTP